jgi:hypothetical protein
MVLEKHRPEIPDSISPDVSALIRECWAQKPRKRPSFAEILWMLDKMDFRDSP